MRKLKDFFRLEDSNYRQAEKRRLAYKLKAKEYRAGLY